MLQLVYRHIEVQVHFCTCSIRKYERPWRFKSSAVFAHLDAFRDVLHALQDIFQTASAFTRMERIEVGGFQVDSFLLSEQVLRLVSASPCSCMRGMNASIHVKV